MFVTTDDDLIMLTGTHHSLTPPYMFLNPLYGIGPPH